MTKADMLLRLKRKLSFRVIADTQLLEALADAKRVLENSGIMLGNGMRTPVPWFLELLDHEIPMTANVSEYDLPDDYVKEVEDQPPYVIDADEKRISLVKSNPMVLAEAFGTPGSPTAYYLTGTKIRVLPAPEDDITLYLNYIKTDDDEYTLWGAHCPELLIGVAGAELAGDLRDASALTEFEKLVAKGAAMLWDRTLSNELTNRRTGIGVMR